MEPVVVDRGACAYDEQTSIPLEISQSLSAVSSENYLRWREVPERMDDLQLWMLEVMREHAIEALNSSIRLSVGECNFAVLDLQLGEKLVEFSRDELTSVVRNEFGGKSLSREDIDRSDVVF